MIINTLKFLPPGPGLRDRLALVFLVLFAFSAWSMTAIANVALALLVLLSLLDGSGAGGRWRRDPALWLLLAGILLTTLLAWRAALLFPDLAHQQWSAIPGWIRPLLFVVPAWWLRGDPVRIRWVLVAALLGLLVGVLQRSDGDDVAAIIALLRGQVGFDARGDFGFTALGLGFLVSIALLGFFSFWREITGPRLRGQPRPLVGWGLWTTGVAILLAILLVLQTRGAVLALALVILVFLLARASTDVAQRGWTRRRLGLFLLGALLILSLASAVLWTSGDRIAGDVAALTQPDGQGHYDYGSSSGTRLNLYRIGVDLIRERPLLGWGPGTRGPLDLVPAGVLDWSAHDRAHAPEWAHLHSVPIEIWVRFGLLGLVFGCLFLALMVQSYGVMRRSVQDPPLFRFLLLGGIMTLLFCLYDFRLIRMDFGFFFVLFFGILYSFRFALPAKPGHPAATGP
ncbi:MAG: O-antigen ligase family protein [Chromatiaceae bacterium]